jgi:hypothetical protein
MDYEYRRVLLSRLHDVRKPFGISTESARPRRWKIIAAPYRTQSPTRVARALPRL